MESEDIANPDLATGDMEVLCHRIGVILAVSPAVLLLAVSWGSLVRLRIEGDEVQVVHPFLGGWGNRAFRFGEIASVEVRVVIGRKEVRIVLHDGSSIRYIRGTRR